MCKYGFALGVLDDQKLERRRVAAKLLVPPFVSRRENRALANDKRAVHADHNNPVCVVDMAVSPFTTESLDAFVAQ